ncbi:MAG: FIST N-terminal domain-containing protein [Paracoccaceae bacterium]|nr:FIST N-terminal domain-containing protein [Paracoccaceae bacterium]
MDGAQPSSAREDETKALCIAQVRARDPDPVASLVDQIGTGPFALVCIFASPEADFRNLSEVANQRFGAADVLACTTAGELGNDGYEDGQIIAVGFRADLFASAALVIENLDDIEQQDVIDTLIKTRMALTRRAPDMVSEFAFLMVDGLSQREEHLTATLASGLGPVPLFGGSAGDGENYRDTWLSWNGEVRQNAGVLALVRSHCPVKVFSLDHFAPTDTRMVVTKADPERRIVSEINAEPAAKEYARILGKDPEQLGPYTFAAHPVVVRLGNSHHVRAIQQVNDRGELCFFSAINEGMVLTLASHQDMGSHLEEGLSELARVTPPQQILGCDCLLRKIEVGQIQRTREISDILKRHNVVGFSTYGEQIGALHVNQTLTGVAIYPPQLGE